jgi:hypothetical protein
VDPNTPASTKVRAVDSVLNHAAKQWNSKISLCASRRWKKLVARRKRSEADDPASSTTGEGFPDVDQSRTRGRTRCDSSGPEDPAIAEGGQLYPSGDTAPEAIPLWHEHHGHSPPKATPGDLPRRQVVHQQTRSRMIGGLRPRRLVSRICKGHIR